jgi:hypothetical protein
LIKPKLKNVRVGAIGGDIQSTISDPLAYFMVPLYEHNLFHARLRDKQPRGRTVQDTLGQFIRILPEWPNNPG